MKMGKFSISDALYDLIEMERVIDILKLNGCPSQKKIPGGYVLCACSPYFDDIRISDNIPKYDIWLTSESEELADGIRADNISVNKVTRIKE